MIGLLVTLVFATVCGAVATVLWVAFWTLAIPWEGHSALTASVFIAAGVGTGFMALKTMRSR